MANYASRPIYHPLKGAPVIPGDKSLSHRALLMSAIAEGRSTIKHCLLGEDNLSTIAALKALGVDITLEGSDISIEGKGKFGLTQASSPLDLGNSGTSMRLLAGLLAAQPFDSTLLGDDSLMQRPMLRVAAPLRLMGARIFLSKNDTAPIYIEGQQSLAGISYQLPYPSAQVKSAILLAGLYASGTTQIKESLVSRNHTELMLQSLGYPVKHSDHTIIIDNNGTLAPHDFSIPGDVSSAAFFMVAATIVPGSDILLKNIGLNDTRCAIIPLLQQMGADITCSSQAIVDGEPVGDIRVKYASLQAITVPQNFISIAIDEFPIFFIAAALASGTTFLSGASELRVKESDRLAAMEQGLNAICIKAVGTSDGLAIEGGGIEGGVVHSYGDHRIAMAFLIAGAVAKAPIEVLQCDPIATSFPAFFDQINTLGYEVNQINDK